MAAGAAPSPRFPGDKPGHHSTLSIPTTCPAGFSTRRPNFPHVEPLGEDITPPGCAVRSSCSPGDKPCLSPAPEADSVLSAWGAKRAQGWFLHTHGFCAFPRGEVLRHFP